MLVAVAMSYAPILAVHYASVFVTYPPPWGKQPVQARSDLRLAIPFDGAAANRCAYRPRGVKT
jgi:hypothetical protein